MSGRIPHPEHRIAGVNPDGRRFEKESTIANHHCDRGGSSDRWVENQEWGKIATNATIRSEEAFIASVTTTCDCRHFGAIQEK